MPNIRSAKAILMTKSKLLLRNRLLLLKRIMVKKFPMTIKTEATEKTLHHIMLSVLERGLACKWIAVSLLIFAADVFFIAATFQLKNLRPQTP